MWVLMGAGVEVLLAPQVGGCVQSSAAHTGCPRVCLRSQSVHLAQAQRAAHRGADGAHAHGELRELEPADPGHDGQRLRRRHR